MILIDYDNAYDECVYWWEEAVSNGCKVYISIISLMEWYKGLAHFHGLRSEQLERFEERIRQMRRDKKIWGVLPINAKIAAKAHKLLIEYCLSYTPSMKRSRMEALICDMLIASTALLKGLPLYTFNQKDFEWIPGLQVLEPPYERQQL